MFGGAVGLGVLDHTHHSSHGGGGGAWPAPLNLRSPSFNMEARAGWPICPPPVSGLRSVPFARGLPEPSPSPSWLCLPSRAHVGIKANGTKNGSLVGAGTARTDRPGAAGARGAWRGVPTRCEAGSWARRGAGGEGAGAWRRAWRRKDALGGSVPGGGRMHHAGHLASRGLMGSERLARCGAFSLLISRLITQDAWQLALSPLAGGPGYHSRAGGSGRQQQPGPGSGRHLAGSAALPASQGWSLAPVMGAQGAPEPAWAGGGVPTGCSLRPASSPESPARPGRGLCDAGGARPQEEGARLH